LISSGAALPYNLQSLGQHPVHRLARRADNTAAFNSALADLKATNAAVTNLNAALQISQARHTVLNKAIDSMNEAVVRAGSTHRARRGADK